MAKQPVPRREIPGRVRAPYRAPNSRWSGGTVSTRPVCASRCTLVHRFGHQTLRISTPALSSTGGGSVLPPEQVRCRGRFVYRPPLAGRCSFLVQQAGLEPAASRTRTVRSANCATAACVPLMPPAVRRGGNPRRNRTTASCPAGTRPGCAWTESPPTLPTWPGADRPYLDG